MKSDLSLTLQLQTSIIKTALRKRNVLFISWVGLSHDGSGIMDCLLLLLLTLNLHAGIQTVPVTAPLVIAGNAESDNSSRFSIAWVFVISLGYERSLVSIDESYWLEAHLFD